MVERFGPERFAQLIETLPLGVFILDASGTAIYSNAVAKALLGRGIAAGDRADNLGERYSAYIAGTDETYPTERMPIVRALAGERSSVDDLELDRDGERVALEVTATPIFDGERLVFAVAVFQDITERRRAQQALAALNADLEKQVALRTAALERASRAKSVFLMNVSHELRTPLNHIIGFSELLSERLTDERSRRLAKTAEESGRDLLGKINELIELARVDVAPARRELTTFDFDAMLDELGARCVSSIGNVSADVEAVRRVLIDVVARVSEDGAPMSVARDGRRVIVSIESRRMAGQIRGVAHLFGERVEEKPFQQQEVDFRLAVARAQARLLGGDIIALTEDVVQVLLPAR